MTSLVQMIWGSSTALEQVSSVRELLAIKQKLEAPHGAVSDAEICEHTRRLAEIVLISEQKLKRNNNGAEDDNSDEAKCLEIFFSQRLVERIANLAKQDNVMLQIQALQTLSILAQCLSEQGNFFQFLSQNHVNSVLAHDFGFLVPVLTQQKEELLAHYVTLVKTLSLRMTNDLVQFFFNQEQFPLYDKSALLVNYNDSLVRATVRSVILQVHLRCFTSCEHYIRQHAYFTRYCQGVRWRMQELKESLDAGDLDNNNNRFFLPRLQTMLQDVMDDWSFLGDVMSTMGAGELHEFLTVVIDPLVQNVTEQRDAVSMWMLAQCLNSIPMVLNALFARENNTGGWFLQCLQSKDERIVQAACTICYLLVDNPLVPTWKSARKFVHTEEKPEDVSPPIGSEQVEGDTEPVTYPYAKELVETVLNRVIALTHQHEQVRPVTIRLLCKLLVHAAFDSDRVVLRDVHLQMLRTAIAQVASRLISLAETYTYFVDTFENEWHELKTLPSLQIQAILIDPHGYLPMFCTPPQEQQQQQQHPLLQQCTQEQECASLIKVFLLLRLSQVSLAHNTDHVLPSLGNADVVSVTEDSFLDLRHCKKFFELQIQGKRLYMVLVSGALLLVEPTSGQCRTVCPMHRIEVVPNQVLDDPRVLLLCICSMRRIGLAVKFSASSSKMLAEYRISLRFESEAKALFAKEHIERSAKRAKQTKLKRITDMLFEYEKT